MQSAHISHIKLFNNNVFNISSFFIKVRKKATYDKFGERGLKEGIPAEFGSGGAWSSKYDYHGNPAKTFFQFFGGDNPFGEKTTIKSHAMNASF